MRSGQRREQAVFAGVAIGDGIEIHVLRLGFVYVVRARRVAVLLADITGAAERRRPFHPQHEFGRDGLSGFVVLGEGREHLRTLNQLLEHLRRSLDEIRFHGNAADSGPGLLTSQDHVHQMSELMEESLHVAVFHEAGIPGGGPREIAYENAFRELLAADTVDQRHHFRVRVLAWARMHIHVEPADDLARVDDLPGLDRRIPGRNAFFPPKLDVEQGGRGVEYPLLHAIVGKIRTHRLRIEIVARAADLLLVVALLLKVDGGRAWRDFALLRETHLKFPFRDRPHRGVEILYELRDPGAAADHLVGRVVVRPGLVPEQRGDFIARAQHLHQDIGVLRIGAGIERKEKAAAQGAAHGKIHRRYVVGVVRGDADDAGLVGLVAVDEVFRQAVEFRRIADLDGLRSVVDVALEGRLLLCEFIVEHLQARPNDVVLVYARPPKLH